MLFYAKYLVTHVLRGQAIILMKRPISNMTLEHRVIFKRLSFNFVFSGVNDDNDLIYLLI